MGHKVNPIGLRLGIIRTWDSRWYADDNYADLLQEDLRLRKYLKNRLKNAGVSGIVIERAAQKVRITLNSARPGVIIGKKGADIDKLKADVGKLDTLRADIDYGQATAFTTYGTCGVKVWVFKGEVLSRDPLAAEAERRETRASR